MSPCDIANFKVFYTFAAQFMVSELYMTPVIRYKMYVFIKSLFQLSWLKDILLLAEMWIGNVLTDSKFKASIFFDDVGRR